MTLEEQIVDSAIVAGTGYLFERDTSLSHLQQWAALNREERADIREMGVHIAAAVVGLLRQGPAITVYWERISNEDTWAWEPLIDDDAGLVATRWDFPDADPPNTTTKPRRYAIMDVGEA